MASVGFWQLAQQSPDKLALAAPGGRHWSRGELLANCNRVSHGLRQLGLQPGDRVAAMVPNCAEFLSLNLATSQIGCTLVPINCELDARDVATILRESGARAFLAHERVGLTAQRAQKEAEFPLSTAYAIGDVTGFHNYQKLVGNQPDTMPANRMAGSVCNYDVETDGQFKAVTQTYSGSSPEEMAEEMTRLLPLFDVQPEAHNVHFCGSQLYIPEVMLWTMNSLHYGHSVVLADHWDAMNMLQSVDRYRVTTSRMEPSQFLRLLEIPEEIRERYDVSSTRHMISSTTPCPADVKQAMTDWWGESIYELDGDKPNCTTPN